MPRPFEKSPKFSDLSENFRPVGFYPTEKRPKFDQAKLLIS